MNTQFINPLVASYGFNDETQTGFTFILPGKEIKIEGAGNILPILLAQCNGFNSLKNIINSISISTGYKINEVEQLAFELLKHGIIIDAREQYLTFHNISANPMPYLYRVSDESLVKMLRKESKLVRQLYNSNTQLEKLFEVRASTRKFSGKSFSREEFLRLAWAMYGKTKRSIISSKSNTSLGTVPSGGALYPLCLYGISMKVSSLRELGVYEFNSRGASFLRLTKIKELIQIFGEHPAFNIEEIAGIFIIICNFKQVTQKYSNRGYRLALLEAGHAAQNAYLWCAEQGLGVVEVGGFNDEYLARALKVPYPNQSPLTVLIVGRKKI